MKGKNRMKEKKKEKKIRKKSSYIISVSVCPFQRVLFFYPVSIPGGALLCLPLASYFPRYFLSRHFWSEEQRMEFSALAHKKRISYYRTLLGKLKRRALRKMPVCYGGKGGGVADFFLDVCGVSLSESVDVGKISRTSMLVVSTIFHHQSGRFGTKCGGGDGGEGRKRWFFNAT